MKRLIQKIVIFLLLLFAAAIPLQNISDRAIRSFNKNGWADIYDSKINADIIIQGNSRAQNNILPTILDSVLKTNSYNLGIGGFQFFMQYYRFLVYMKHNKAPKYIIQNVDNMTISKQVDFIEYTQFLPYFNDSLVKEEIQSFGLFDWRAFYIPYYKYIGNFDVAYQGLTNCFTPFTDSTRKYKGFIPMPRRPNSLPFKYTLLNSTPARTEIDTATLRLFTRFLDLCKKNKTQVILVFTPYYYLETKKYLNMDSVIWIFRKYSTQYNIPFLDYRNDSICFDSLNFANPHHLNMAGAKKFSRKLAYDLKSILK